MSEDYLKMLAESAQRIADALENRNRRETMKAEPGAAPEPRTYLGVAKPKEPTDGHTDQSPRIRRPRQSARS